MAGDLSLWSSETPSGVYRNHSLSNRLYETAISKCVFAPFAALDSGYGKGSGETHDLPRMAAPTVPSNRAQLSEDQSIPVDKISMDKKQITIAEFGRGIEFTSKLRDLSKLDLPAAYRRRLMEQMKLAQDASAADAFKQAKVKYIPNAVGSGVFDTDGTASTTATFNLNFAHLEEIRDYMFGTLKMPGYDNGSEDAYVCIANWKAIRGLRNDPKFETWNQYANAEKKFNGEMGKIENIRFVVTNNTDALSATKGSGSVLGEAVLFGQDPIAHIIADEPELRMQMIDYDRKIGIAWYGMYAYDIIWDTANAGQARIVHVTSA